MLAWRAEPNPVLQPGHEPAALNVADVGVEQALFDGNDGVQPVQHQLPGHLVAVHRLHGQQSKDSELSGE